MNTTGNRQWNILGSVSSEGGGLIYQDEQYVRRTLSSMLNRLPFPAWFSLFEDNRLQVGADCTSEQINVLRKRLGKLSRRISGKGIFINF